LPVGFGSFTMTLGGTLVLTHIADTFRGGVLMNVGGLFVHPTCLAMPFGDGAMCVRGPLSRFRGSPAGARNRVCR
jgi:hypothetical protein